MTLLFVSHPAVDVGKRENAALWYIDPATMNAVSKMPDTIPVTAC